MGFCEPSQGDGSFEHPRPPMDMKIITNFMLKGLLIQICVDYDVGGSRGTEFDPSQSKNYLLDNVE